MVPACFIVLLLLDYGFRGFLLREVGEFLFEVLDFDLVFVVLCVRGAIFREVLRVRFRE